MASELNTLQEWAFRHAELGYCPVPVFRGERRAACIAWKPWQTATPAPEDLEVWFGDLGRNISLVCGAFHSLVVVDCDDARAIKFARLQFGPTPYRILSSRGMHLYYRHPGPGIWVKTDTGVIPGYKIDIRGDGGMIAALGSTHRSGYIYRLDDGADMVSIHDLPVWSNSWLPRAEPLRPPELQKELPVVERASRYLAKIRGAGKGQRNTSTFATAAAVVRDFGLNFDQGWALISAWNAQENDPPLPEDEIRAIVRSCLASGKRPFGCKANQAVPSPRR